MSGYLSEETLLKHFPCIPGKYAVTCLLNTLCANIVATSFKPTLIVYCVMIPNYFFAFKPDHSVLAD